MEWVNEEEYSQGSSEFIVTVTHLSLLRHNDRFKSIVGRLILLVVGLHPSYIIDDSQLRDMPSSDYGREILKDVVFRFAPETQHIRRDALDEIVKNCIYKLDGWVNEQEVDELLTGEGSISLSPDNISDSLERLYKEENILRELRHGDFYYKLSDEQTKEVANKNKESNELEKQVIQRLSVYEEKRKEAIKRSITDVIAYVFAELGEESISMISGSISDVDINYGTIMEYCDLVAENERLDSKILKKGVKEFFEKSDPYFNRLKWKYAQSFFISKSLGVEYGESTLGSNRFDDAAFYIDTNVAIPAVEPADRLHRSFELIQTKANQINASFRITTNTIDELNDWANNEFGDVKKALQSVPEEFISKTNSIFGDVYKRKLEDGTYDGPQSLFENLNNAENILENEKGVEIIRNGWFTEEKENETKTEHIVDRVRSASQRVRNQDKNPHFQALHDALLIRWTIRERQQGHNAWILTADTSLPKVSVPSYDDGSLVVTMDALIQWLSPVVRTEEDRENFRDVFSELVKNRLFPQSSIFTIDELNVFSDLGVSVESLPEEDVEEAIKVIRSNMDDLNLNKAEDREIMMGKLKKIISSPEREYKRRLKNKQEEVSEKENMLNELQEKYKKSENTVHTLKQKIENVDEKLEKEREKRIEKEQKVKITGQAWRRLIGFVVILLVEITTAMFLGLRFSPKDQPLLSRMFNYSGFLGIVITITLFIFAWLIRKDHLAALGIISISQKD